MDEVDEAIMIMFRFIGGAGDVIKQGLQITGNIINAAAPGVASTAGNLMAKPLEAGKKAVSKILPKVGEKGEVSVDKLNELNGDNWCLGTFEDDELKQVKKHLKGKGVEFAAVKNRKTGDETILIKAANAQIAQEALSQVAREMDLLSQDEIAEFSKPEITDEYLEKYPLLLEEPDRSIIKEGHEWTLTKTPGKLEYICEYGMFDLKADSNGKWEVSKMGEVLDSGYNISGLSSAMLSARACADEGGKVKHQKIKTVDDIKNEREPVLEKEKKQAKSKTEDIKGKRKFKMPSPAESIAQARAEVQAFNKKHKKPQHSQSAKKSKAR